MSSLRRFIGRTHGATGSRHSRTETIMRSGWNSPTHSTIEAWSLLKTATFRSLAAFLTLWLALICSAAAETPARVPLPQNNPSKNSEEKKQESSKPASALFSQKQLPSIGNAVAIGYYPRGCLQGGVELPITGPTWQVMRVSRNRNWGHPGVGELLGTVRAARCQSYRLAWNSSRRYGAAARRPTAVRTQEPSNRA